MQAFRSAIFFSVRVLIYADVNTYSIRAYMFDGIRILGARAGVAEKLMRCVPSLLLLVITSLFKGLRQPAADRKLRIFVVVAAQQRLQQQRRPRYNARCVEPRRVAKELEPGRSEFGEVIEKAHGCFGGVLRSLFAGVPLRQFLHHRDRFCINLWTGVDWTVGKCVFLFLFLFFFSKELLTLLAWKDNDGPSFRTSRRLSRLQRLRLIPTEVVCPYIVSCVVCVFSARGWTTRCSLPSDKIASYRGLWTLD